jgi:hypothetical protein
VVDPEYRRFDKRWRYELYMTAAVTSQLYLKPVKVAPVLNVDGQLVNREVDSVVRGKSPGSGLARGRTTVSWMLCSVSIARGLYLVLGLDAVDEGSQTAKKILPRCEDGVCTVRKRLGKCTLGFISSGDGCW